MVSPNFSRSERESRLAFHSLAVLIRACSARASASRSRIPLATSRRRLASSRASLLAVSILWDHSCA